MDSSKNNQSDSTQPESLVQKNPARLRVTARRTVNLGDYNSLTYEVSVEEDQNKKKQSEQLDLMFDRINGYLAKKFIESGVVTE